MSKRIIIASLSIAAIAILSVATTLLFNAHTPASALSGSEFNQGRIIDDSVFYNDSSMTTAQIQRFLESKVPDCDYNGTQSAADWGYPGITHAQLAQYKREGSHGLAKDTGFHAPPYKCLTRYSQTTPQMEAASGYCAGINAGTRSAAQIINDVAKACDINPQVLIVLLEKEQSLVTDNWPLTRQLRSATGFACPDTAPCNPDYEGFFYQVFNAARQFKVYQANPNNYNYIAGRSNRVYWHPDLSRCGSSNVYIQNQATAALYIYTPYRPNGAALNNLYGTGDSCSSYGNRNFWRLFTTWFGSTVNPGENAITVYYNSLDDISRVALGSPTSLTLCKLRDSGCYIRYTNGAIIWTKKTGAWESYGSIRERWTKIGAQDGALGYPIGPIRCVQETDGCYQKYEYGYIIGSPDTGYWESKGGIRDRWGSLGYQDGSLGYPTGPETSLPNRGWQQNYERGVIIGSYSSGYWASKGSIRERWLSMDSSEGALGYPTSNESQVSPGIWSQSFQNGVILGGADGGYWASMGSIRSVYLSLGEYSSNLGLPTSREQTDGTGVWWQEFQHGNIVGKKGVYNESTGLIFEYWSSMGKWQGEMGLPISKVRSEPSGTSWQYYRGGALIVNPVMNHAWESRGSIRNVWASLGYQSGELGYPTGPERFSNGIWSQSYEHGTIETKQGKLHKIIKD